MTRRIVLTGVSRGLGRALTEKFVAAGHTVFGAARSAEAVDELNRRHGGPSRFVALDVRCGEAVQAWADCVIADGGPPDLLVQCAAVIHHNAPLWSVPPEEFAAVVDVNLKGVFHVIHAFVPGMVARRRGVIVHFSSYWGRSVSPEAAPYCASKWGIEGLTAALAEELPAGMAAVPLNPGIIDTDMLRICFGESAGSYPKAEAWAEEAAPFILSLGPQHNGKPLTVPSH